ncbi:MAG: hypothetical protein RQ741_05235 [Wenzhouxiangellaceae bacterium]|nr:hypothetical protein [Wenzhouxiangellaceae bacterium]
MDYLIGNKPKEIPKERTGAASLIFPTPEEKQEHSRFYLINRISPSASRAACRIRSILAEENPVGAGFFNLLRRIIGPIRLLGQSISVRSDWLLLPSHDQS